MRRGSALSPRLSAIVMNCWTEEKGGEGPWQTGLAGGVAQRLRRSREMKINIAKGSMRNMERNITEKVCEKRKGALKKKEKHR